MSHRKSRPRTPRPRNSRLASARSRALAVGVAATLSVVLGVVAVQADVRWAGPDWFEGDQPTGQATGRTTGQTTGQTPGRASSADTSAENAESKSSPKKRAQPDESPSSSESGVVNDQMRRYIAAQRRLARKVAAQLDRRNQPLTFRVATLNVLGDSHTGPGGNKPGYPDASARMDMTIGVLRSQAVDVVGFQEFESTQYQMFTSRAGEYDTYPGLAAGNKSVRFNIAWRTSMWSLVEAHTIPIPYAGGSRIDMPVVLLENGETGRRAWFANFHNPADTPSLGSNARWRAIGSDLEVAHLTQLHQETGHPVVVTGDFNERDEIFCKFTAGGVFGAAAGGSNVGGCAPPDRMGVDWIFGSSNVTFSGYAVSGTGLASDHDIVHAEATLVAQDPTGG